MHAIIVPAVGSPAAAAPAAVAAPAARRRTAWLGISITARCRAWLAAQAAKAQAMTERGPGGLSNNLAAAPAH